MSMSIRAASILRRKLDIDGDITKAEADATNSTAGMPISGRSLGQTPRRERAADLRDVPIDRGQDDPPLGAKLHRGL